MNNRSIPTTVPFLVAALLAVGCSNADSQNRHGVQAVRSSAPQAAPAAPPVDAQFGAYWYQGKAELTRFALDQARYGEIRHGDAVLIFVTEDFLADKEVKLESEPAGRPVLPILKLNLVKKFATGIYSYSMMTSVFTPVEVAAHPHSLKVSTSSQEWCGHTFTQLNLRDSMYHVELRSYFEKEGDRDFSLDTVYLEDEVWTHIRLAPERLPTGRIRIIPGTMAQRLRHTELDVETAAATLEPIANDPAKNGRMRYTLNYGNGDRTLSIEFESAFPHRIMEWSETYKDGFGAKAHVLTTHAVRTNEKVIDYWTKNSTADDYLRRELGLP
ncbi:MAG TPA: hypothetical protein VHI13_03430 [Candidatus Kapabacteria bacterium]|nr:hypothetical protein [Candidatus Kapabacteria bacterium]